jgi:hypothetical protein
LEYDAGFINRWSSYIHITGDIQSTRGGNEIQQLKRRKVDAKIIAAFENEPTFPEILKLLGYA